MIPYARFYGAAEGTAFFQHMTSGEPIVCEEVDSIVSCFAPRASRECDWLQSIDGLAYTRIGDAIAPRSVEEAVLEAVRAALTI